jgi:hypothetical protein
MTLPGRGWQPLETTRPKKVYTIKIFRWGNTPHGVFGHLQVFSGRTEIFGCFTVERPWVNNLPNVSCIPAGAYRTKLQDHVKEDGTSYKALELLNVIDRDNIEIHIANTMDDLKGCIGVGSELGWVKNRWAVTNSTETYKKFMAAVGDTRCVVRIEWLKWAS